MAVRCVHSKTVDVLNQPSGEARDGDSVRWVYLQPDTSRFVQVGEMLAPGTFLGHSAFGAAPEVVTAWCRVIRVMFDVSEDRLVIILSKDMIDRPVSL